MEKAIQYIEKLSKTSVILVDRVEEAIEDVLEREQVKAGLFGHNKITDTKKEKRLLFSDALATYTDTEVLEQYGIFDVSLVYSELAKFLSYVVKENLGVRKYRYHINDTVFVPVHFANAGVYDGEYSYVDIKSFYYSVYTRFWGARFKPMSYLGRLEDMTFFFEPLSLSKPVRVSIFGLFSAGRLLTFKLKDKKLVFSHKQIYNTIKQPDLVNLIYAISQAIGFVAVNEYGAIYCNTDGFIIPSAKVSGFVEFLKTLGFRCSVKASGNGAVIKNAGMYSIGDVKTKHFDKGLIFKSVSNIMVDKDFCNWLFVRLKGYEKKE